MSKDMDIDFLDFGDDSDPEHAESSDDEIDILLHGTPEQKRKLCRPPPSNKDADKSSSEDEFEKEMNAELNGLVREVERRRGSLTDAACSSSSVMDLDTEEPMKYYDDVYFDSDEEDMVNTGEAAARKRTQPTNDDLLYDPNADDEDEKWVVDKRRTYQPKGKQPVSNSQKKQKPLPNSDAVLDCPACMTTLCLDCQRHDVYPNQYRAMFVMNCRIDTTETLKFPKANNKRKRKKSNSNKDGDQTDCDDRFNPIKCEECDTVVAVIDNDEVYHFFNTLASY